MGVRRRPAASHAEDSIPEKNAAITERIQATCRNRPAVSESSAQDVDGTFMKRKPSKKLLKILGTEADAARKRVSSQREVMGRVVVGQLRKDLHKFVDDIVQYGEDPAMWPLTAQEQIAFIRKVIHHARKIRNTEEYLAESVAIAAEELALAS